MIEYSLNGRAMKLSVETSRAAGHLSEIDGVTPDGSDTHKVRAEIARDAAILADTIRAAIAVCATAPDGRTWQVDEVCATR